MKSVSSFDNEPTSDGPPGTPGPRGLGWFSLALGAAEIAIPRALARAIGVEPGGATATVMRILGAREVVSGAGVLLQPRRPLPLWARVAGDLVDLGLLGLAARSKRSSAPRVAGAIAAVAGVMALDVIAARRVQRGYEQANRPVLAAVTINKPPMDVYKFYRKLEQLPLFMDYLESVTELDDRRTHWVAKLPVIGTISWDAEIIEDRPGEVIAWQSVAGAAVKTRGRVTFTKTPGRDMTEVRVEMRLGFTGKAPSTELAKLFAKPAVKGDLTRLKQVIETGEVLVSDATAHRGPHPAQPSPEIEHRPLVFIPNPPTAEKGVTR